MPFTPYVRFAKLLEKSNDEPRVVLCGYYSNENFIVKIIFGFLPNSINFQLSKLKLANWSIINWLLWNMLYSWCKMYYGIWDYGVLPNKAFALFSAHTFYQTRKLKVTIEYFIDKYTSSDAVFYTQSFAHDLATVAIALFISTLCVLMQSAFKLVQNWCNDHEEEVNTEKTKLILFTLRRKI